MSVVAQGARLAAIARRDLQTERSYHLRHLVRLLEVGVTGVVIYNLSKIVVGAPQLDRFGGDYFPFAMVGLAVMSVARLGISAFNQNIMREQTLGTFEVLLVTPTPLSVLLAGSFAFPLLLTLIDVALYFGFGIGVFGGGLPLGGVLLAVPLLALTLASFCAFGIAGASIVVLAKRGDPLTGPLTQATAILSGALFPVSVFPWPMEALAHAFPAYYGINGLREALLASEGLSSVGPDLAVLAVLTLVALPVSVRLFAAAVAAALRAGTLGNY